MDSGEVNKHVNDYGCLRDVQFAAYELYARRFGLTAKELFVLDIVWFSDGGCFQSEICERLSATRQTVSAIVKKFLKAGYVTLTESETDRRNKVVRFTEEGRRYAEAVIVPAARAENEAMAELSDADITALVRITTKFSCAMKEKFEAIETKPVGQT